MADILVYIPDLPSNIPEDDAEEYIQTRIETVQRMVLKDVKCYLKLGVAAIQMRNEEDKNQLVSNVVSMVLGTKLGTTISFVSELELDTYIVLDRKISKIPSADEVARRYAEAYKSSKAPACECISVQFPNIFRIFLNTLDELVKVTNTPDFRIEDGFATVYPRADCSFFEDLPPYTNAGKVSSAIATQMGESQLAPTSFHVQCNEQIGNAVVIAPRSAKNWMTEGDLTIDGRNISKKAKLAYRVLVTPVPRAFNVDHILHHRLFAGRVVSHKHIDESLILEIDDVDHYQECLEMGAFGVNGTLLTIKSNTVVSDPGACELDDLNWYETAMFDIKPDIVTILSDHHHPIFRYKWNAENWIQQMKKAEATDRRSGKYDLNRHLLRVTVMLNTIAILRKKKYVVDGQEVTLKLEPMRTIGYNHQSTLATEKKLSQVQLKTPYSSTTVKVVNEDCLVLYEQLVSEGRRPLLLNMANAVTPGGGYRKGDGAQEENVFRRSDYYHSLDGDIADKDRSERLYCTSKGEIKPLKGFANYYPMDEFGAIYTSGIAVFRQTEAKGYAYMKNPLYNVCSIAMAAYRDPPLTNKNTLENKSAINTHKKIENIFAIAHHRNHDCLVLSALGCGAFKNPPKHVALLFKSVIQQYAGYFDSIYFAIIDDHNTGNAINPHGNFGPFKDLLDGLVAHPPKVLRANGVTGPHRILDKTPDGQLTLGEACISHVPPCQHGSMCRDMKNADHNRQFSHPPICSFQSMTSQCDQMNDEVHTFTFVHILQCKDGGECIIKDGAHFSDFDHPDFCKDEFHCKNISPDHSFAYRHLPVCRDGIDCSKYLKNDPDHIKSYRHCQFVCSNDNCCIEFHDEKHTKNAIHSFRPPCPFTPYNCSKYVQFIQNSRAKELPQEIEDHCLRFSHVCPYGRQCQTTDDRHYETSIHIARHLCPDGKKCSKRSEGDHLESFSHPDIRDIRLFCREPGYKCPERFNSDHSRKYRHGQNHDHLNVAPSSKGSLEIPNWIRALQPVHRCNQIVFQSILVHGHVMSRHYMKLLNVPKNVAKAVLQHSRIRLIFLQHNSPVVRDDAYSLIRALIKTEFSKTGFDGITVTALDPDHDEQINTAKMRLKAASLSDADLKVIQDWTVKIAEASITLHSTPMGIGYDVDEKMGTDKHVFSILGPHRGHYYGDIIITFKQEIMFHPDANFSIQAATTFNSGKTYKNRPWVKDRGTDDTHVEDFHHSKLHCSVPRYEHAAATELAALTGKDKQSMDVDLNAVIKQWMHVDSHDVFEAHLPQLIPLDYVDCVYMPKNIFEALTPEAKRSAKEVFSSLIITPHVIDLSLIRPGATVPLDSTRIPYQKFVLEKIDEKIHERMDTPRLSRGIVITVPGSRFEEHIILPITISQSYDLYRLDKPQTPNNPEYTYIYWQAMHGDMMLTIANEKILSTGEDQSNLRCLVCYVARIPSTNIEHYHEDYSYLNGGHPIRHDTNVHGGKFLAKSNVFYRGCNTDDFFTFCLKIVHKTGEVTLSHAGPNSIYNHEKIHYQFNKSDLDLSRIDYVHVSGGNRDIPIRNLTINHESVPELHPSFDPDFKIDTSILLGRRRASISHMVHSTYDKGRPNDGKNVVSQSLKRQPGTVQPAPSEEKEFSLMRVIRNFFGPSTKDKRPVPNQSSTDQTKYNPSTAKSSGYNPSKVGSPQHDRSRDTAPPRHRPRAESPPSLMSSKLPPCSDSVYCLKENSKDHTDQYSHPCRFNELCRRQTSEPHLVHANHKVPKCSDDRDCRERTDPVHRAKFRHSNLPDYLVPCRFQDTCYEKAPEHRLKYFHGEELPSFKKNRTLATARAGSASTTRRTPCKWGNECRSIKDPQHAAKFSHPTSYE